MKRVASVVLFGALLGGCATNTSGIDGGIKITQEGVTPYAEVHNSGLDRNIELSQFGHRRIGELLQGSAQLASQTSGNMNLQYRFTWFDKDGFPIESDGQDWIALILHGYQSVILQGTAPTSAAETFKISVREVPEQ